MAEMDGMALAAGLGLAAAPVALREPGGRGWIFYMEDALVDGAVIPCYQAVWDDGRSLLTDDGHVLYEFDSIGIDLTPDVLAAVRGVVEPRGFRLADGAIRRDGVLDPEAALRDFMALAKELPMLQRALLDARHGKDQTRPPISVARRFRRE